MDSEWSMDFAFPLLSLLRTNGSVEAAKNKARSICYDNERLDGCLMACDDSSMKKIMRIGLQPWTQLCSRIDDLISQFDCWKTNVDVLSLGCHLESHHLRQSMETFTHNHSTVILEQVCRNMNVMSICNIEEHNKFCGHTAKMLLVRLFRTSRKSFQEMLKLKWKELPEACTEPIRYYAEEESALSLGHSHQNGISAIIVILALLLQ
uniref:Uncharacterized protein n=1 Tax=Panagrellus redivivus TaxID=6233 RepID=A0A7E4VWF3_PANRE